MPHDSEVALLFYLLEWENKRENEGVKMKLEY